ncbi:hypothetical protein ACFFJ7_05410 [Pseudochelatococcus lubricantis]|uniref:hypothetical protein n=1 Tax=Pseudochelatococcus lubricantis TaxID=1538102 RepID=UPI0035F0CFC2
MPNTPVRAASGAVQNSKRIQFTIHPDDFPEVYAMVLDGHCMEPWLHHDQKLVMSKTEAYKPGDIVALFIRPELLQPGQHQILLKRLKYAIAPWARFGADLHPKAELDPLVIVEQINPRRELVFRASQIQAIHKCLGPVPDDVETYVVTDDEAREIARRERARRGRPA